jgi:hypothetical protein
MTNQQIIEKLKGKEIYGFKFKYDWNTEMDEFIGQIGVIHELHDRHSNFTHVIFEHKSWYYPTQELEKHLVDQEPIDINALFNQISKL